MPKVACDRMMKASLGPQLSRILMRSVVLQVQVKVHSSKR